MFYEIYGAFLSGIYKQHDWASDTQTEKNSFFLAFLCLSPVRLFNRESDLVYSTYINSYIVFKIFGCSVIMLNQVVKLHVVRLKVKVKILLELLFIFLN